MTRDNDDLHDLNNQLAIILGFCSLLIEDTAPDDPRRRELKEIYNAAINARDLIGRLFPARDNAAQ